MRNVITIIRRRNLVFLYVYIMLYMYKNFLGCGREKNIRGFRRRSSHENVHEDFFIMVYYAYTIYAYILLL